MAINRISEDRLQQECVMWFWNTHTKLRKLLFSVPNGGARSSREGKLLKQTGLTPGVSDLILLYNGKAYLLEAKTEFGYQSKLQKEWQDKVEAQGFEYYIFRSVSEFINIINNIIKNK